VWRVLRVALEWGPMARPTKLPDSEITAALAALPGWARTGDVIGKSFQLPTFPDAIAFVVRVGFFAERADHHPDLDIRWRRVDVALTTHDAEGLTQLDLDLAREIESIPIGGNE
jgi:4a-hydroxytetrahydrobiopterin dehydratase